MSTSPGHHYVDQAAWSLEAATPVTARAGDVLVFSYLLVHGSYPNTSDRCRHAWHTLHTRHTLYTWHTWRYADALQGAEDVPDPGGCWRGHSSLRGAQVPPRASNLSS